MTCFNLGAQQTLHIAAVDWFHGFPQQINFTVITRDVLWDPLKLSTQQISYIISEYGSYKSMVYTYVLQFPNTEFET